MSTEVPASTSAGYPRTVCPPLTCSTVWGNSGRSSGQARRPLRSHCPATAAATA
ncbi:Uncharacterised protein [Mycobacteroides abscessus subsp. abscessus]|nr:Uncharacterised protein [Mycobacteroides abscessus subsp. abscessus]